MKNVIRLLLVMLVSGLSVDHIWADDGAVVTDKRPVLLIQAKDVHDVRRGSRGDGDGGVPLQGIANVVEGVLADLKIYRIITDNAVERSIQDEELFRFLNGDTNASDMKITVPGYRLGMDVTQFETDEHTEEKSMIVPTGGKKHKNRISNLVAAKSQTTTRKVTVGIQFKIIEVKTQETIFAEKVVKSSSQESKATKAFGIKMGASRKSGKRLDTSDYLLAEVVDDLMIDFVEKLKDSQSYHVIACSDDGKLTVDAPSGVVQPGDVMKVIRLGEATVSRKTGKTIRPETHIATVRVTASTDESATVEFLEIDDDAVEGDWHVVFRRSLDMREKVEEDEKKAAESEISVDSLLNPRVSQAPSIRQLMEFRQSQTPSSLQDRLKGKVERRMQRLAR